MRQVIRRRYIPVLVDYDDRPDLFRRLGGVGLPFTVMVSPNGEVMARLPGILTPRDTRVFLEETAAGRVSPAAT